MEVTSRQEFERLKEFPFFKGVIISRSMEPLIKVGDRILVEVGTEDVRRFDVIVFWSEPEKKIVCHYLWARNRIVSPVLLQTRSFLTGNRDLPISLDLYLGKVVSHRLSLWNRISIVAREILRF